MIDLEKQNQQLKTNQILSEDEHKGILDELKQTQEREHKLRDQLMAFTEQMGVPKIQVDNLKKEL